MHNRDPSPAPIVSIVIAFLNGGTYIHEAVASVLRQDLADWELIFVDDGSTDESSVFASELSMSDQRIIYLQHPDKANHGRAASRVLGSDHAAGKYLLFLDHDDVLLPDALSSMTIVLEKGSGARAVFAGTVFWAFDKTVAKQDLVSNYHPFCAGLKSGRLILRDLIRSDRRHPANCSTLYHRKSFLTARSLTEPYDGSYEDTALLFKLLCLYDIIILEKPVSYYRLHSASMSHRDIAQGALTPNGYNSARHSFLRWASRSLPVDRRSRFQLMATLLSYKLRSWVQLS